MLNWTITKVDFKLFFVMFFFAVIFIAATVYLFKHPSELSYAAFLGSFTAMGIVFHWICTYDDKHPDEKGNP